MRRSAPLGRQVKVGGQHVIGLGHGQAAVVDDREIGRSPANGLDVALPFLVVLDRVHRYPDHLGLALLPFVGQLRHRTEFRGADRGKVARVAEDDAVAVAQPVVKPDGASRAFGGEVGGNIIDADGHGNLFGWNPVSGRT